MRTRIGAETAGLRCDDRDAAELKIKSEEHEVEAKIARAVAGLDLTFSASWTIPSIRKRCSSLTWESSSMPIPSPKTTKPRPMNRLDGVPDSAL